jgi:L-threonylcarbamoyladenylate synthase
MIVLKVAPLKPDPSKIREAVRILDADGVVMYPTESSYALGANALRRDAVKKVLEAKGRHASKLLPVIMADLSMWKRYSYFSKPAETLVKRFMPGPLTIALRKRSSVPDEMYPSSIAARIPGHPVALALVKLAEYPITSTSANISGQPPVYSAKRVPQPLRSMIDLTLDAGTLRRRKPSTIVDFMIGPRPKVTREGAISAEAVFEALAQASKRKVHRRSLS